MSKKKKNKVLDFFGLFLVAYLILFLLEVFGIVGLIGFLSFMAWDLSLFESIIISKSFFPTLRFLVIINIVIALYFSGEN